MTTFVIPGPPVPKGRPRMVFKDRNGNPLARPHAYTPKRTVDFEELVAWSAKAAGLKLDPEKRYTLTINFYLSAHRSDLDNLCKACLDGMQRMGQDWDDSQVDNLLIYTHSVRDASEEKTVVEVEERSGHGPTP